VLAWGFGVAEAAPNDCSKLAEAASILLGWAAITLAGPGLAVDCGFLHVCCSVAESVCVLRVVPWKVRVDCAVSVCGSSVHVYR